MTGDAGGEMFEIGETARVTAGIVMLTVVGIESGGVLLLRIALGRHSATDFQKQFFRAGHAHAGMFVTLGLVCLLLAETTELEGFWRWLAGTGVLVAAVLLPGGFFLSAAGTGRTEPNGWKILFPAGIVVLAAGVVTLAVGLLAG